MRLLITGASGQLGRDVARAGRLAGHDVTACSRAELDIADSRAIDVAMADARPHAVVNCAAYTDVDGAEDNLETALAVNARAAGALAAASARHDALILHVSTDYVFDGSQAEPYVESDEPRPQSAYGRSKLAGEQAVAAAAPRHAIVRTSWLFGTGGANFVDTMLKLGAERPEVGVVTDQVGCPTFTGHLGPALIEVVERPLEGVRHIAAGGECSWHDFAVEIFRQAGLACEVRRRSTADLGRPAPRPAHSVLRSELSDTPGLAPWAEGLTAYLAEREATPAAIPAAEARPAG